jgi:hypothetical protein
MRARRTLVWAAILAVLAAALAFVPLFDVLGFELAFVVGLVASFAAADLGAALVRRRPDLPVAAAWVAAAIHGMAILVPPLLVITANGLRVRSCDYGQGLIFYALLPGLGVIYASAAGVFAQTMVRGRLGAAAAWLIVAGSIVWGIARFYATPPIFGYDPFAGYFPGSLYDENIELSPAFAWARLYQAAVAVAALAVAAARRGPGRLRPAALALVAAGAAVALRARAADLGFLAGADDIGARMLRIDTPHFTIYYPHGAGFLAEMPAIALDHELRWKQVARAFGVEPKQKIVSYYFASGAEKARWTGAENTYIAKPWRHEIYLAHEEFPHGSLRHEIAHVFAGEFGDALFHVSVAWWGWPPARFNVGLIEGAAVAADWPGNGALTPDEAAKAMLALGYLPPLRTLLAPGFFEFSTARSYSTAGSFCHFLLERHGAERFRALYRSGGDFRAAYGVELAVLEAEWRAMLAEVPLSDDDVAIARERFRRRGIFSRPCPHDVARLQAAAQELIGDGLAAKAVPILERVCREDPGEPAERLALAAGLERAHRDGEAAAIYRVLGADDSLSTPLRARALLRFVDLEAIAGRIDPAAAAVAQALALPVDETTRRNLIIRAEALGGSALAPALRRYIFARGPTGGDADAIVLLERAHEIVAAAPAHGIGHYLAGRMLGTRGAFADAQAELEEAVRRGLLDPLVGRENDRLLAAAAYLAGDRAAARAAALRLAAPGQPAAVRLHAADWLERLDFPESPR